VKEEPGHIDQRDLARILREQWGLVPGRLRHLPVGFGDHHWELTGAAGGRWFVTVAGLAGGWRGAGPAAGFADLRASMETVTALHRAGLEFAVAPVPTAGGQALARLGAGHAVAVFPYAGGAAGDFGDGLPSATGLPSSASWPGCTAPPRWPGGRRWLAAPPPPAGRRWRPRSVSSAGRGAAAPTASPRAGCWPGTPPACAGYWRASMSWCAPPPAAGRP
jgi:spectinomycin phosphotransferase